MSFLRRVVDRYSAPTDPERSERRLELLALTLGLAFLLQILYHSAGVLRVTVPEPVLPTEDSLQLVDLQRAPAASFNDSEDIRARPLFWPSRGRVVPTSKAIERVKASKKTPTLETVRLLGVFGGGETRGIIALVNGEKERILLGDKVVGWKLDSVSADKAVFTRDGQTRMLGLVTSNK